MQLYISIYFMMWKTHWYTEKNILKRQVSVRLNWFVLFGSFWSNPFALSWLVPREGATLLSCRRVGLPEKWIGTQKGHHLENRRVHSATSRDDFLIFFASAESHRQSVRFWEWKHPIATHLEPQDFETQETRLPTGLQKASCPKPPTWMLQFGHVVPELIFRRLTVTTCHKTWIRCSFGWGSTHLNISQHILTTSKPLQSLWSWAMTTIFFNRHLGVVCGPCVFSFQLSGCYGDAPLDFTR